MRASNLIYETPEGRPFWKLRPLQIAVTLAIFLLMVAVLYYASPNAKLRGFRWVTPGSIVAIVVWIVASAAFAFYVSNFGSYDKTYGTLGGLVALLIWFWISNIAILFGHQLNAERERSLEIEEGTPRAEQEIQLEPRDEPNEQ
jgi:membrane protein